MRKGFTLIELLAIIIIIGVLASFAAVNVVSYYKKSADTAVLSQEAAVLDAANLAIVDFCNRPIDSRTKKERCIYNENNAPKGIVRLDNNGHGYVCLDKLKAAEYYTSEIVHSKSPCMGYVLYDYVDGKFENGKTYLFCVNQADKSLYDYQTVKSGFIAYLVGCGYNVK